MPGCCQQAVLTNLYRVGHLILMICLILFYLLTAISPLFGTSLEIYGIEHTRKQETDRISAMASELRKLGQEVVRKNKNELIIHQDLNKLKTSAANGVHIDTYKDHRFAISFAILGCLIFWEMENRG